VIKQKLGSNRVVLRNIDGSTILGGDALVTDLAEEVMRVLDQLPKINGAGHRSLEIVSRLTPSDATEVMRVLKNTNPGVVETIRSLGLWFPADDKHHVRHTLLCLLSVVAASGVEKLHRLQDCN